MELDQVRAEIRAVDRKLEQRLATLATKADLVDLATKVDLIRQEAKADLVDLATKVDLIRQETKAALEIWGGALLEHLRTELVHHIKAYQEATSSQVSVVDDKYADLPGRVSHLEATVFSGTPR